MTCITDHITHLQNRGTRLLLSLLFLATCSPVCAATKKSLHAEMGLALAGIPFDIAAHHYAITNKKKTAALLHLTTDTISILNKICCLYNNCTTSNSKNKYGNPLAWTCGRDLVVNSALALRDMQQWYHHLKKCFHDPNNEAIHHEPAPANMSETMPNELAFVLGLEKPQEPLPIAPLTVDTHEQITEETISRLAYAWQVVILPCLKGFTAFTIAGAQTDTKNCPYDLELNYLFRCATTAAHALTKLLDEYASLEKNSPYKKLLTTAIVINLLWFGYELNRTISYRLPAQPKQTKQDVQRYAVPLNNVQQPIKIPTECTICYTKYDPKTFKNLACGHAYCTQCLMQMVTDAHKLQRLDRIRCPQAITTGKNVVLCEHFFDEQDIKNITNNNQELCAAYGNSMVQETALTIPGYKHCPYADCNYYFINDTEAKETILCPGTCKKRYCINCLTDHVRGAPCADAKNAQASIDQNGKKTVQQLALAADIQWKKENTQQCSKCHRIVWRVDGCNHMTCTCGNNFCFQCGLAFDGITHAEPDCKSFLYGNLKK